MNSSEDAPRTEVLSQQPSVVVGVDGSQASILALRWAGVIAPLMKAEIRAVTA